jgi:ammonium transporter Rh
LKLHDTCSVQSLHGIPGLIAAVIGAIFAACATWNEYNNNLYDFYPARAPIANTTEFYEQKLIPSQAGAGRSAWEQAGWQLIALAITAGFAIVGGAITGLILRLPLFEQLSEDVEMFDDEAQWVTPDDYALKLTFASSSTQPAEQPKKEDSKV